MIYRLLLFLAINFGGLAIGSLFTSSGVASDWYGELDKAPWTPPGWVFGAAWTIIMIGFSLYLAYLWPLIQEKRGLIVLYILAWALNVSWNPVFFYYRQVLVALIIISALTVIIGIFIGQYWPILKLKSILLFPYFIWLLIATSLNGYIYLQN